MDLSVICVRAGFIYIIAIQPLWKYRLVAHASLNYSNIVILGMQYRYIAIIYSCSRRFYIYYSNTTPMEIPPRCQRVSKL